jgi:hypothetical protein
VAVGLDDSCFPAAFALPMPYWFGPWLRFQSPLVKPDMQISGIKCGAPHLMRNVASVVMWRWAWKGRPAAMERFSYAT